MDALTPYIERFEQWSEQAPLIANAAGVCGLLLFAFLAHWVTRRILIRAVTRFAAQTATNWDDALIGHHMFRHLSQIVPALLLYFGIELFTALPEKFAQLGQNIAVAYGVFFIVLAIGAFLNAISAVYDKMPVSRERPLKGFIQIAKIIVYFVGAVMVLAAVLDRSPLLFFSGLGALTAVLMLVFKDTLMSLVASVQIATSQILRIGDWVEMPQYGADGEVIDIALHTVRVQNWDKTVTTIPTYRFISDAFKNWRYMSRSGGRRIKRAVHLDVTSVRFLKPSEVDRFRDFALLTDYVDEKRDMLAKANADLTGDANVNARRLTNVGTFRAYVLAYLQHSDDVNQNLTLLVRQLDPGPQGLPLQIYAFTKSTDWGEHERVKSDIFDHLIAIVPSFGLRVFQEPAGADFRGFGSDSPTPARTDPDDGTDTSTKSSSDASTETKT